MKKIIVSILLLLAIATQAAASGSSFPNPLEGPMVYAECPQPIKATAAIGMVLMVPTTIIGAVTGLIAMPFYSDEVLVMNIYAGAIIGNLVGSAITGAPAYFTYRLFNWDGCPN